MGIQSVWFGRVNSLIYLSIRFFGIQNDMVTLDLCMKTQPKFEPIFASILLRSHPPDLKPPTQITPLDTRLAPLRHMQKGIFFTNW